MCIRDRVNTYDLDDLLTKVISVLDYSITVFFVIEIIIRFVGEQNKKDFFKSGWNIFDSSIVLISLIPINGWVHFEVKNVFKKDAMVELFAVCDKNVLVKVKIQDLKSSKKWISGWKKIV